MMGNYYDLPLILDSDRTLHELHAIINTLDAMDCYFDWVTLEIGGLVTRFNIQYPKGKEKELIGWIKEMESKGLTIDETTLSDMITEAEQ